jgi:hypothetical protein
MPLNARQLAKVHTAVKQLGMSDADYRELLGRLGVRSSKELNNDELDTLLNWLVELGYTDHTQRRPQLGDRAGMASDGQLRYLTSLWRQWHGEVDSRALDHWLENSFGVSAVRFLSQEDASKAIEALKVMVRRDGSQRRAEG